MLKNKDFSFFKTSDVFILLMNVKMPTIVGILTFMSRINVMLSWIEHEKKHLHALTKREFLDTSGATKTKN